MTKQEILSRYVNWKRLNRRRCELIDKEMFGQLSKDERYELSVLTDFIDSYIELTNPRPTFDEILQTIASRCN